MEVIGDNEKSRFCDKVGMEAQWKYAEERMGCEDLGTNLILEVWP